MAKQLELFTSSFRLTDVGLEVVGKPDFEDWMEYGQSLKTLDGTSRQFAIGDWISHGFDTYEHGKWETVQQIWGNDARETLRVYEWVSRQVKSVIRITHLSFSHHQVVADMPPEKQRYWLDQASINKWSVNQLRLEIETASSVKLYKGDMLEIVPGLGTFQLICTDPPYGVTDNDWDILDTERWLNILRPHLAPEYNIFWFCSPWYAADTELIFRDLGLPIQSRIIWHRRNMATKGSGKFRFMDTWEMILHAGNRELNFPDEWTDAWFDVQTFASPQTNFNDRSLHPTQKPEGLIQRLVDFGSYPDDNILDPFAGSGTTGAVCPKDRNCTLIEREEGYVGIIEGRLRIKRQKP